MSTMMTSNGPLEGCGKLPRDIVVATAILHRFLHHAESITFAGHNCPSGARPPTIQTNPESREKMIRTKTSNHREGPIRPSLRRR